MRRVRITLGYDGTDFSGSQSQPGERTVQDELDALIQRLAPGSGRTTFAGRTDSGVHAIGQVASVDVTWRNRDEDLRDALNAIGPADLAVSEVRTCVDTFHARYDALRREYRYRIVVADTPPVLERRYVWWRWSGIDSRLAAAACRLFTGRHAFGTFAGMGKSQSLAAEQLERDVTVCEWHATASGSRHELRVVANGFLPGMVRNMTAAIVDVGTGRRPVEWIAELIAANDRRALGKAAPPEGLVLWRVTYTGDEEV